MIWKGTGGADPQNVHSLKGTAYHGREKTWLQVVYIWASSNFDWTGNREMTGNGTEL